MVTCDRVAPSAFHRRLAVAGTGGVFADGYGLGIIGIALANAGGDLPIRPLDSGLIGGAALAGLFIGALLTGPLADRMGRRPIFAANLWILLLLSLLQSLSDSVAALITARFLIGAVLGSDYVVSKAVLAEWMPDTVRGRVLAGLAVAWAAGYATAYCVGYGLQGFPSSWRWMLASSALPCLLVSPLRWSVPESPAWLQHRGRTPEATVAVARALGPAVVPAPVRQVAVTEPWSRLFSSALRVRTVVACTVFVCQVIPYFALGTFIGRVLSALAVRSPAAGGIAYNAALLGGAVLGLKLVDRMPRRQFLVGSFSMAALMLAVLLPDIELPTAVSVSCVALFAAVVSGGSNIIYVYLPELFPTGLRASGIGLAIAASRVGSAVATFLLPIVVDGYGVRWALSACVLVLLTGAIVCARYAPETRVAPTPLRGDL
jgi:putative MFS transporter